MISTFRHLQHQNAPIEQLRVERNAALASIKATAKAQTEAERHGHSSHYPV